MIQLTTDTLRSTSTNYDKLSLPQRIILSNGGSLTKLMEVLLNEPLVLNKIYEKYTSAEINIPELHVAKKDKVIMRKITLKGARSKRNWIYAESIIAINNLDPEFSDALLKTNIPIGKIWEMLRVETYKRMVAWGDERAAGTGEYFNITNNDRLLYRTYQVYTQRLPVMLITEKFPSEWYADNLILPKESYSAA